MSYSLEEQEALVRAARPSMLSMKLNGPRYMLVYAASACCGASDDVPSDRDTMEVSTDLGRMEFMKIASLKGQVGVRNSTPYVATSVHRSKNFSWCAGCEAYILRNGVGEGYIMQSYSQYIDSDMSTGALRTLGSRLLLPAGWTYTAVNLTSDFTYAAVIADVLTDEFENSYTRMYRPDCAQCRPP